MIPTARTGGEVGWEWVPGPGGGGDVEKRAGKQHSDPLNCNTGNIE